MTSRSKGLLLVSLTAFLWGTLAIFLKASLEFMSVTTMVWVRFFLAALFLALILYRFSKEAFKKSLKPNSLVILSGIFLGANYIGFFKGLEKTSASNAQIFIQLGPLMLAAIGIFYFKETLKRQQKLGFLVALVGLSTFYSDQFSAIEDGFGGNLWLIFAAISWAAWASLQKVLQQRGWPSLSLNLVVYAVGALIFLPTADFSEFQNLGFFQWLLIVYLAVNTLVAYGALTEGLKHIPANQASMIISLNPLLTLSSFYVMNKLSLDWVAHEPITIIGYLGAALLVIGVILVVSRKKLP